MGLPLANEDYYDYQAQTFDNPKIVNMHDAKTHLSALVNDAVAGEPFIIAKSGKPQVIVYAYVNNEPRKKRTGFWPDLVVPDDFDSYMADEIAEMFGVND